MKTAYKLLIAATTAAVMAAGAGAGAQGFGPCGGGSGYSAGAGWGGPGMGCGAVRGAGAQAGPAANAEARLAYLESELKLAASQSAAWTAYENAVKQQAAAMQAHRDAMIATQSAPERVALMSAFATQRAYAFGALNAAVTGLYAVLTPEQKVIADASLHGRMLAMGPRGSMRGRPTF